MPRSSPGPRHPHPRRTLQGASAPRTRRRPRRDHAFLPLVSPSSFRSPRVRSEYVMSDLERGARETSGPPIPRPRPRGLLLGRGSAGADRHDVGARHHRPASSGRGGAFARTPVGSGTAGLPPALVGRAARAGFSAAVFRARPRTSVRSTSSARGFGDVAHLSLPEPRRVMRVGISRWAPHIHTVMCASEWCSKNRGIYFLTGSASILPHLFVFCNAARDVPSLRIRTALETYVGWWEHLGPKPLRKPSWPQPPRAKGLEATTSQGPAPHSTRRGTSLLWCH